MHFQQPNMLWGLLLLAIPLLIHLFQFHRTKTIYFPGVFRLTQRLKQARQQKKLQHLLVLISRMLGIACLVFAFALPSCENTNSGKGYSHVVILVDNGFSMGCKNANGELLEQAKSQIRAILTDLNAETQVQLLSQTGGSNLWMFPKQLESVIDTLRVGPQRFVLNDWVERVQLMSKDAGVASLVAIVLSDAQSGFVSGKLQNSQERNIDWRFVQMELDVSDVEGGNLSLDSAWYVSQFDGASTAAGIILKAKVTHRGGSIKQAQLQLKSGDKTIFAQQKDISEGETLEFEGSISEGDMSNGMKLTLGRDGFLNDNELFLHSIKSWKTSVGVLGSHPALDAMLAVQPLLVSRKLTLPLSKSDFGSLDGLDAIICVGEIRLGDADLAGLKSRVEGGLVCLQFFENAGIVGRDGEIKTIFGKSLGGRWIESGQRMALPGLNHPVFQGAFSGTLSNKTTLPEISTVFQLGSNPNSNLDFETIIQLEGGTPTLIQQSQENGTLWVWLADLNKGSQKLLQSSWFLPLFTQIVGSKSVQERPLYGTLFSKQLLSLPAAMTTDERAAKLLGKGGSSVVDLQTNAEKHTSMYVGAEPSIPGYYRLESPASGESMQLAFNWPRNESDLLSLEDWEAKISKGGIEWQTSVGDGLSPIIKNEPLKVLWRLFIWGAAFFFALEVLMLFLQSRKSAASLVDDDGFETNGKLNH